jgi:signal transduction histidine kinase
MNDISSTQARLATLGQLVASIGHEVQQPLAGIALNAGAALRWLDRPQADIAQARAALAIIVDAAAHANEVVRGIRRLAQGAEPDTSVCLLDTMLSDVLAPLRRQLTDQRILLSIDVAAGAYQVFADPVQLRQVLLNLVGNAIDALCGVAGRERTLHIAARPLVSAGAIVPARILITISDSGIGLPRHAPESVFEPLVTGKRGGMGMGLAICRAIVEAHGGTLRARPGEVHGSVFEFTMPAAPSQAADAATGSHSCARQR